MIEMNEYGTQYALKSPPKERPTTDNSDTWLQLPLAGDRGLPKETQ
jgi:hypothetical protein